MTALPFARALATLLVLAPSFATANTMELYGFGPRIAALGNTGEAVADDYFALYANPANLALASHIHFGFGGEAIWNRFAIDRTAGTQRYPSQLPVNNQLAHVGISTPLGGFLKDKAALGVAIQLPFGNSTRLDAHDYRTPQVTLYDTLADRLVLVAGIAVRPVPWLSLGASAQLLTTLDGRADIDLSILDHRVTQKSLDVQLLTKPYGIFGVTLLPNEDFRIGLVYRMESYVRYALPLAVRLEDVGNLNFRIAGVGLWLPDTIALATSFHRGAWLFTAGAAYARWSQLPPQAPDVRLVLDDGQLKQRGNPPDQLLYVNNVPIAMAAKDIVQPRAGVEWQFSEGLVWRAGVQYRPTFLPRADGAATYLDAPATTLAVGAGLTLADPLNLSRKPLHLDATLGYTVMSRRTVQKRDAADPIGATSLSGDSIHLALALHHDF